MKRGNRRLRGGDARLDRARQSTERTSPVMPTSLARIICSPLRLPTGSRKVVKWPSSRTTVGLSRGRGTRPECATVLPKAEARKMVHHFGAPSFVDGIAFCASASQVRAINVYRPSFGRFALARLARPSHEVTAAANDLTGPFMAAVTCFTCSVIRVDATRSSQEHQPLSGICPCVVH
jgi:hypothetical protein